MRSACRLAVEKNLESSGVGVPTPDEISPWATKADPQHPLAISSISFNPLPIAVRKIVAVLEAHVH